MDSIWFLLFLTYFQSFFHTNLILSLKHRNKLLLFKVLSLIIPITAVFWKNSAKIVIFSRIVAISSLIVQIYKNFHSPESFLVPDQK